MYEHPSLFAVGVPRSGTTLLQRMLDRHPQLAVANDTHFIPRALENTTGYLLEKARNGLPIPLSPDLIHAVTTYHRFHRMGLTEEEVGRCARSATTYRQFVSCLYGRMARKSDKQLSGEKTPDYVRRMPILQGLFPFAKFVHIVRDGRDVALSLIEWATASKGPGRLALWRENPMAVAALWWRWLVNSGLRDGARIGEDRYLQISYETLTRSPEESMRRVTTFLELPFSTRVLTFEPGARPATRPGASAKRVWRQPVQGLRNWRRRLSDEQLELFEALAGDALKSCGYELHSTRFSNATVQQATACRKWWEENFPQPNGLACPQVPSMEADHATTDP